MDIPVEVKQALHNFPEFEDVSLENKLAADWFFNQYPPEISEYTFTNLYVWRRTRHIKLSLLDRFLCIMAQGDDEKTYMMPPIGDGDLCAVAEKMLAFMEEQGHDPSFARVPEDTAQRLKECGYQIKKDRDNSDYVYLVDDLANLEGRKYDGKRNRIKKCITEYNPQYEVITPDIIQECLQLQTEWCDVRHCDLRPGLASENVAIKEIFSHMEGLPVFGCAIMIDDKIEAFSLGEKLNTDTAVVHFEKANPDMDGLYQVVNQWFCQREMKDYIYVNREQDLGIPGLRKAKKSYHPHHKVDKYTLER
jgi:hypothetical protein